MADSQEINEKKAKEITSVAIIMKAFADTTKSMKGIKPEEINKNVVIFQSISKSLGIFLQATQDIIPQINNVNVEAQTSIVKSQNEIIKVIESAVKLIETLGNTKFPNMIKLRIKLWIFKNEFGSILDTILGPEGLSQYFVSDNVIKSFKNSIESFEESIDSVISIFNKLKSISQQLIRYTPFIVVGIKILSELLTGKKNIVKTVLSIVNNEDFIKLGQDDVKTKVTNVNNNLILILETVQSFIKITNTITRGITIKLAISMFISRAIIRVILDCSKEIVYDIYEWTQDISKLKLKNVSRTINTVSSIINSLRLLIVDIIILAISAPVLFIITPVALISVLIISLFVKAVISILKIIANKKKEKESLEYSRNLSIMVSRIIGTMLLAGAALLLLGLMGVALIKNILNITAAFLITSIAVILIAGIGFLIKKLIGPVNKQIMMGLLFIVGVMAIMDVVAGMLLLLGLMGVGILKNWWPILATFLIVLAVLGIVALLGLASEYVAPLIAGGFAMMALTSLAVAAMLVIAMELRALMKIAFTEEDKDQISASVSSIIGAALTVIAAVFMGDVRKDKENKSAGGVFITLVKGVLKSYAMIYGALAASVVLIFTVVAVTMMLIIAGELWLITKIKIDRNKVYDSVTAIMDSATMCIDAVFGDAEKPPQNGPIQNGPRWEKALLHFFAGFADLIAIALICLIGLALKWMVSMNIPSEADVFKKVTSIMNSAYVCIDAVFGDAKMPEEENKQNGSRWEKALLHFFSGLADVLEIVVTVYKLAYTLVAIGLILLLAKELEYIAKIDISEQEVAKKVNSIMLASEACVRAVFHSKEDKEKETQPNQGGGWKDKLKQLGKNVLGNVAGMAETIAGIPKVASMIVAVGMIATLGKSIEAIDKIEFDEKSVIDKTNLILSTSEMIINKIFSDTPELTIEKKNINLFNSVTKAIRKFIKVFDTDTEKIKTGIDKTIEFVDKINTVDLEKLQTTANLFEKMAQFSESINGNFEGLADALNEKIAPLLENLKEQLENIKNSGVGSSSTSDETTTTSITTSRPVLTPKKQMVGEETGIQSSTGNWWEKTETGDNTMSLYDLLLALNTGLFGNPEPTTQSPIKIK